MKKTVLFLVTILTMNSFVFCQEETSISKKTALEFETNYNSEKYQEIFSMFSENMKEALPKEQAIGFFKQLMEMAGVIEDRQFVKYDNGTYALYKTKFEKGVVFALRIAIDEKEKIDGIDIGEYKDK